MQRKPAQGERHAVAERAQAFIETKAKPVEAEATAKCRWGPDSLISVKGSAGNVMVGEVTAEGTLSLSDEALNNTWGITMAAFNKELAEFKQD